MRYDEVGADITVLSLIYASRFCLETEYLWFFLNLDCNVVSTVHMSTTSAVPAFIPQPDNYAWLIIGCFTCLIFPLSCCYLLRTTSDGKIYDLGGLPILSAWPFFSMRYGFMRKN